MIVVVNRVHFVWQSQCDRGVRLETSLSATALAAILWSYEVHEKQLLVSLVPLGLLHNYVPLMTTWMFIVGVRSVLPLLVGEGFVGAYVASQGLRTEMANKLI